MEPVIKDRMSPGIRAILCSLGLTCSLGLATGAATIPGDDQTIVHALNRVAFGPRPGDLERVRQLGVERYIDAQLHPERIADTAVEALLADLPTLGMSSRDIAQTFEIPMHMERRARRQRGDDAEKTTAPQPDPARQRQANQPVVELSQQKLLRAVYSERQLLEVLTDFWFNHFNVDARKGPVRFMLTEYERDVIRPHVFGRFRDLLEATAKSPAMLFYLDNWMSADPNGPHAGARPQPMRGFGGRPGSAFRLPFGADSIDAERTRREQAAAGQGMRRGLNENYGRELMELHTLGVDGGYTQQDVTEVARAFTGWTIQNPRLGGGFVFEARLHDPGRKVVLGHTIDAGGQRDGERVLDILAAHPSTSRFIATKLARRFVSDEPPAALVDRAAARFRATGGDLREVTRTILTSPEFLSADAHHAKIKTPFEFVVSAVRATGLEVRDARPLVAAMRDLGMPLYFCQPPTGYQDSASAWVNTGALLDRMNLALALASGQLPGIGGARGTELTPRDPEAAIDRLLGVEVSDTTRATIARASTGPQMIALSLGSPEFQRR
jgi:uncharacterized protein (DUF1800 family)